MNFKDFMFLINVNIHSGINAVYFYYSVLEKHECLMLQEQRLCRLIALNFS